jgi:hypothetical protein
MKEIWKDIKGYEGLYQVSNLGKVKSLNRYITNKNNKQQYYNGKMLSGNIRHGYLKLTLSKDNIQKTIPIHILVAKTFIPNPENKPEVNHIDGNKSNNCVNNLEWCTRSENELHAYRNGLAKSSLKQKEAVAKYAKENYSKKVLQYNLNGDFIKEWNSMHDVWRELGIRPSYICRCCKGLRNHTFGYIWKYK